MNFTSKHKESRRMQFLQIKDAIKQCELLENQCEFIRKEELTRSLHF